MNTKLATYGLVALIATGTLTNCSGGDRAVNAPEQSQPSNSEAVSQNSSPAASASTSQDGTTTEIDRVFIEMMVPHHQSANEMAQMAVDRAENPDVKELAQSIIEEQTREIQQMQEWYSQWYGAEIPDTGMSMEMHDQMRGQPMMLSMQQQEQMDEEMMAALENAENFDQEFLRQMTRHHQMATMMAGMVVDSAERSETRELAQAIIESQSQEIAQMQQLLPQVARQ